jgi:hypothetical protein
MTMAMTKSRDDDQYGILSPRINFVAPNLRTRFIE